MRPQDPPLSAKPTEINGLNEPDADASGNVAKHVVGGADSQGDDTPDTPGPEFRGYRVGLAAVYLGCAGLGSVLLISSIVASLTREASAVTEQRLTAIQCHQEISAITNKIRSQLASPIVRIRIATNSPPAAGAPAAGAPAAGAGTNGVSPLRRTRRPRETQLAVARLVAQCERTTANSPTATRILASAVKSLAEATRGYSRLANQIHRDVIAPLDQTEASLAELSPLLSATNETFGRADSDGTPNGTPAGAPK